MNGFKTTQEIAAERGVTPQCVNRWRTKAEKKYGTEFGTCSEQDGRVKIFNAGEVQQILSVAPERSTPVIEPEVLSDYEAVNIDGAEGHSLVPLTATRPSAPTIVHFSDLGSREDAQALAAQNTLNVTAAGETLNSFAEFYMARAAFRIKSTVDAVEANAMGRINATASNVVQREVG